MKPYDNILPQSHYTVSRTISKLVPQGTDLQSHFNSKNHDLLTITAIAAKVVLDMKGPETIEKLLIPVDDIDFDKALNHIRWFADEDISELLMEGMDGLDEETYPAWRISIAAYFLFQWFTTKSIMEFVLLSHPHIHPSNVMEYVKTGEENDFIKIYRSGRFNTDVWNRLTLLNLNVRMGLAKEIIERYRHYGQSAEFYQAIKFHPSLPDSVCFHLIGELLVNQKDDDLLKGMMGAWISEENLRAVRKTF